MASFLSYRPIKIAESSEIFIIPTLYVLTINIPGLFAWTSSPSGYQQDALSDYDRLSDVSLHQEQIESLFLFMSTNSKVPEIKDKPALIT